MVPMPELWCRLARLSISADAPESARRRKAARSTFKPAAAVVSHGGVSNDSSFPVRLIALSRLLKTRDEHILEAVARLPFGAHVLLTIRSLAS